MDKSLIQVLLIGCFGAFIQELVHWYSLRAVLSNRRYAKLLRSPAYWVITLMMIVSSGVGTWVWFNGTGEGHEFKEFLLTGAAFPLLVKKAVAAFADKPVVLGGGAADMHSQKESVVRAEEASHQKSVVRDYFQLNR